MPEPLSFLNSYESNSSKRKALGWCAIGIFYVFATYYFGFLFASIALLILTWIRAIFFSK
jgi:hypothetical protein